MSNDNAVTIIGTLTRDPEIRFTPSGATLVKFSIARNTRVKNGDKWEDGPAQFYDVVAWNQLAENVGESLQKGHRVIVFGELNYQSWETDSGDKRSKVEIKAEAVGPELRFATAGIQKITRESASEHRQGQSSGSSQAPANDNPY